MCNHKKHMCKIAVGHRFQGYICMFKAFYITQTCIAMYYNVFILFQAIYRMIEHQKMDHINCKTHTIKYEIRETAFLPYFRISNNPIIHVLH